MDLRLSIFKARVFFGARANEWGGVGWQRKASDGGLVGLVAGENFGYQVIRERMKLENRGRARSITVPQTGKTWNVDGIWAGNRHVNCKRNNEGTFSSE